MTVADAHAGMVVNRVPVPLVVMSQDALGPVLESITGVKAPLTVLFRE
jgi:hypothetical protein